MRMCALFVLRYHNMAVGGAYKFPEFHTLLGDEGACPVCIEVFVEPKSLPSCAHNVCRECLEKITKRNSIRFVECPICRARSEIPQNGVNSFPTNTLLVRIIENIQGRKEQKAIKSALKKAKESLEEARNYREMVNSNISCLDEVRKDAEELKREISDHAEKLRQKVNEHESCLHAKVDKYFIDTYQSELDASNFTSIKKRLDDFIEKSSSCIENVEKVLQAGKLDEIIELVEVYVSQLGEIQGAPKMDNPRETATSNPAAFNMKFHKGEEEVVFGFLKNEIEKEIANLTCREGLTNSPSLQRDQAPPSTPQAFTSPLAISRQQTPSFRRGQLVQREHPSGNYLVRRVTVCQRTGDIAILADDREVYIYHDTPHGYKNPKRHIVSFRISDIAFSINNELIVVDNKRLVFYNRDHSFSQELLADDEEFHFVSVDASGRLIVTAECEDEDCVECYILVYHKNFELRLRFGQGYLSGECGRVEYYKSKFYVPDYLHGTIFIFHSNGDFLEALGMTNVEALAISPANDSILVCRKESMIYVYGVNSTDLGTIATNPWQAKSIAMTKDGKNAVVCFENCEFFDVLAFVP
ncbi:E3 ubiquitin-protein ligase rnf168-like [Nematostella vectensis]|uniref:E3 ubiquitin-protein ligase rnf168-like n=1 Tax=Nematostella vectensis TaxID=45351 RepID=UPI00207796B3|nr:E3 ubiquitin-protein ligase rnf168-like [Nematostella vectensis]